MVITNVNQVVYRGDGVTTAFPFTFRIIDATDIKLLMIDSDGTETDITSDYFVDTENDTVHYPGYAPGAEPALSDRPPVLAEGQKLVIYRKLPITQEKDLGDKWPFYVIELGLDKLTMILQDIWDWLGRCLCVSKGQAYEAGDDFDPTVPLEADKVICGNVNGTGYEAREALMDVNGHWDGEGRQIKGVAEPTDHQDAATKNYVDTLTDNNFMKLQPDGEAWEARNLPISNVAGPALVRDAANKDYVDRILAGYAGQGDRFVFFDNVAQMQAAELVPSQMAVTLGYRDVNDGGAGVYTIRDIGADTPDGGSIIEIPGTNYAAELITDGTVNVKQFGAKGDGVTDDTTAIKNATSKGTSVFFPYGTYKITDEIPVPNACKIFGCDSVINASWSGKKAVFDIRHTNTSIQDFTINANYGGGGQTGQHGPVILVGHYYTDDDSPLIENITIKGITINRSGTHSADIQLLGKVRNIIVDNCVIDQGQCISAHWGGDFDEAYPDTSPCTKTYHPHNILIKNCVLGGTQGECVFMSAVYNVSIENCTFANVNGVSLVYGDYGNYLADSSEKNSILTNITVTNCSFRNSDSDIKVDGHGIRSGDNVGLQLADIMSMTVTNCSFDDANKADGRSFIALNYAKNIHFRQNTFKSAKTGMVYYLIVCNHIDIVNDKIVGIKGCIRNFGGTEITMRNCEITFTANVNLYNDDAYTSSLTSTTYHCDNAHLLNNRLVGNGGATIIFVKDTDNVALIGNNFTNVSNVIETSKTTTSVIVANNYMASSVVSAILCKFTKCKKATVENNVFAGYIGAHVLADAQDVYVANNKITTINNGYLVSIASRGDNVYLNNNVSSGNMVSGSDYVTATYA